MELIENSIVWLLFIKISTFYIFGLYRGVWRYISVSDFFTIFKVVSLGSLFSVLFITFVFRFSGYSRAVFFIDWLVLLFLIMASRFMFRMIGEFLSRMQTEGRQVLIFGAGDAGEMVLREIRRNKALNYNPIGFIDDDPIKLGTKIHGVPVLGSRDNIRNIAAREDVKEMIIAVPSVEDKIIDEIASICSQAGISCRIMKSILTE